VFSKQLQKICTVQERFNIKSVIWTQDNIILYTTNNHIKFALLNGDNGIIKCIENPIYLLQISGSLLSFIDKQGEISSLPIKDQEIQFKAALFNKNSDKIKLILK